MNQEPNPELQVLLIDIAASLATYRGDLEQAARLSGAASQLNPIDDDYDILNILNNFREADLSVLRTALAPEVFEQAWRGGVALDRDSMVEEALQLLG